MATGIKKVAKAFKKERFDYFSFTFMPVYSKMKGIKGTSLRKR